jgi:hypothetical protein
MFCLAVVIVCICVSFTDVFLWGSPWSCIDVVCASLACSMNKLSPCLCSLYLGEMLCPECDCCVVQPFKTGI